MKMRAFTMLYWLMGLMIGLGAFGHGFLGVKPVRAALATVALPADVLGVIWIVWYFCSGCMLVLGALILWAWFAARRGNPQALAVPLAVALFWMAFGGAAYTYQHNPFWLLFLTEGFLLLVATVGLRRIQLTVRRP